jgi:hypothetical protein
MMCFSSILGEVDVSLCRFRGGKRGLELLPKKISAIVKGMLPPHFKRGEEK